MFHALIRWLCKWTVNPGFQCRKRSGKKGKKGTPGPSQISSNSLLFLFISCPIKHLYTLLHVGILSCTLPTSSQASNIYLGKATSCILCTSLDQQRRATAWRYYSHHLSCSCFTFWYRIELPVETAGLQRVSAGALCQMGSHIHPRGPQQGQPQFCLTLQIFYE
jgi:hypothetical protein